MIEDAIRDAIIEKFFEPSTMVTAQTVYDNNGSQRIENVVVQTEAPSLRLARSIWEANKQAITDAVMARLDVNDIVEQCSVVITKSVVERLTAPSPSSHSWSTNPKPSERERMLTKVYDAVAEEFGRQCVEHLRKTGGLMNILDAAPTP